MTISIRPFDHDRDGVWALSVFEREWNGPIAVSRGVVHDLLKEDGLVAEEDGEREGILTYAPWGQEWEVTSLTSERPGRGVGTALLDAVAGMARGAGCRRVWLVTTNDNVEAVRFYQRRGWDLVALHRDAIAGSRRLKPSIPQIGEHGIPIRHELELELRFR